MDPFSRIYTDILRPAKSLADSEGEGLREAEEKPRGNSNTSVFVRCRGFSVEHSCPLIFSGHQYGSLELIFKGPVTVQEALGSL